MSNPMSETTGEAAARLGFSFDHVDYVCPGHNGDEFYSGNCMFCDGGLFACDVCGSFEGATTTQCPGERMIPDEGDAVYDGALDFRHGQWVDAPSFYSPGGYRQALDDVEQ